MIDYILSFPDEATAIAALPEWGKLDENGDIHWQPKPKCGVMHIQVITQLAVWDYSNSENAAIITPEQVSAGYWMVIAKPSIDENLWASPYVVSEHDRALAVLGQAHILRTKLTPEQIAGVVGVQPVFAGSLYPF